MQPFIVVGNFNASSPFWGYAYENVKGAELIEFLVTNNLSLDNTLDSKLILEKPH